MVTLLATTGMRFSEESGLQVRDIDLTGGLIEVRRQTHPGRGGLVTLRDATDRDRVVTGRYLHPCSEALIQAGTAFSTWWAQTGPTDETARRGVQQWTRR